MAKYSIILSHYRLNDTGIRTETLVRRNVNRGVAQLGDIILVEYFHLLTLLLNKFWLFNEENAALDKLIWKLRSSIKKSEQIFCINKNLVAEQVRIKKLLMQFISLCSEYKPQLMTKELLFAVFMICNFEI
jgi:hypothetical protein